jgi:hypothetical protein
MVEVYFNQGELLAPPDNQLLTVPVTFQGLHWMLGQTRTCAAVVCSKSAR